MGGAEGDQGPTRIRNPEIPIVDEDNCYTKEKNRHGSITG